MEKQTTTVYVGGKAYTVSSSDAPEYLKRVAAYANRKLRESVTATRLPAQQAYALAAMNLADELMKAQDENRRLRRQLRSMQDHED